MATLHFKWGIWNIYELQPLNDIMATQAIRFFFIINKFYVRVIFSNGNIL